MPLRKKLLTLLLAGLALPGVLQAADSVAVAIYNATESIYMTGENLYMTTAGGDTIDYEMRISVENHVTLGGISLGFRMYSDNGATWKYNAQPGGYGPLGLGTGLQAVTVASGSRLDPPGSAFDLTGLIIIERDVDGAMSDSIVFGGVAMMTSLPVGPMEHMLSIHFSLTNLAPGETRGICFDSTFVPPSAHWVFNSTFGTTFPPAFGPALCFLGTQTGIDDVIEDLPFTYSLKQNYPNPFNPSTTIEFNLPRGSHVSIDIYNVLGQEVRTLVDDNRPVGAYRIEWNGTDDMGNPVSTGVYLYRFQAGDVVQTKKMLLLK